MKFLIGILGILCILLSVSFVHSQKVDKADRILLVAPPEYLEKLTFGYDESIADSLWLRVLQDLATCENVGRDFRVKGQKREVEILGGSKAHPNPDSINDSGDNDEDLVEEARGDRRPADTVDDILAQENEAALCHKGWVFQMLDLITELAPKFRMAYVVGATFLSIMVDDREGARLLYEKGVQQFPDDWTIPYRAGYHYLFEVQNPGRAAEMLQIAARNGAPQWVYALSGRLYGEVGKAELGITVLEDALQRNPTGEGVERIKERLRELYAIVEREKAKKH